MEKQFEVLENTVKENVLNGNIEFKLSNEMYSYLTFYGLGSVSSIKMPIKIINSVASERNQWERVKKDNYKKYLTKNSFEQLGMYNTLNDLTKKPEFHGYKISSFGFQKEYACSVYNVNLLMSNMTKDTWGVSNTRPILNFTHILSEFIEAEIKFENSWAMLQYYFIKWFSQQKGIIEINKESVVEIAREAKRDNIEITF